MRLRRSEMLVSDPQPEQWQHWLGTDIPSAEGKVERQPVSTDNLSILIAFALSGRGAALVPDFAVYDELLQVIKANGTPAAPKAAIVAPTARRSSGDGLTGINARSAALSVSVSHDGAAGGVSRSQRDRSGPERRLA